jgi:hypothetical protein
LTGSVLAAKRIELLHELVPKTAAVIALVVNPTIPPPAEPQAADAETAARSRSGVVFAELGFPHRCAAGCSFYPVRSAHWPMPSRRCSRVNATKVPSHAS